MIQRIAKFIALGGSALMLLCGIAFTLSGASFGFDGVFLLAAVAVAVLAVGAFGLIWILGAAESVLIRFALIFQALRRINAETAKQEMASDFYTMHHPTAGTVAVDRAGRMIRLQPPIPTTQGTPAGTPPGREPVPEIEEPEPMPPALDYIVDSQSLILLGPQGTGKTTLMSHLIDARADYGEMIAVVDPHGFEGKYPGVARIIGAGRSYREIDHFFLGMLDEMNRRYQEYNGRNDWTPISIFVDEMTLITQHVESAKQFMESALTEFRKAHMRLALCLHSRRAKFLGLSGAMDLAEGVDYCNLKKARKERWAELELAGHDEIIYAALPGPYRGGRGGSPGRPGGPSGPGPSRPSWAADGSTRHSDTSQTYHAESGEFGGFGRDTGARRDTVTGIPYQEGAKSWAQFQEPRARRVYESREEKTIVEMFLEGFSLNSIARKVWGSSNGRRTRQLKNVLGEHGLI